MRVKEYHSAQSCECAYYNDDGRWVRFVKFHRRRLFGNLFLHTLFGAIRFLADATGAI